MPNKTHEKFYEKVFATVQLASHIQAQGVLLSTEGNKATIDIGDKSPELITGVHIKPIRKE